MFDYFSDKENHKFNSSDIALLKTRKEQGRDGKARDLAVVSIYLIVLIRDLECTDAQGFSLTDIIPGALEIADRKAEKLFHEWMEQKKQELVLDLYIWEFPSGTEIPRNIHILRSDKEDDNTPDERHRHLNSLRGEINGSIYIK